MPNLLTLALFCVSFNKTTKTCFPIPPLFRDTLENVLLQFEIVEMCIIEDACRATQLQVFVGQLVANKCHD